MQLLHPNVLIVTIILPTFCFLHAQDFQEQQVIPLFAILERPESKPENIQYAMKQIMELGPKILPLLQERFTKTSHPHYFYLMQKLTVDTPAPTRTTVWEQELYFARRYRDAQNFYARGEIEKAQQLAQAIFVLEPNISFAKELQVFLTRCRDLSASVLESDMTTDKNFYNPGETISVRLSLKTKESGRVSLRIGAKSVIVKVVMEEFHVNGHYEEKVFSERVAIPEELNLAGEQSWQNSLNVANPPAQQPLYRLFKLSAYILPSQIKYQARTSYQRIAFRDLAVHCLPDTFHQVLKNPMETSLRAVQFQHAEALFFSSFFLDKPSQARLIPILIANLSKEDMVAVVSRGMLVRFTGKSFPSATLWQNYWYANRSLWEEQ